MKNFEREIKDDLNKQEKYPDYDLFREKVLISRGVAIEEFGSQNLYLSGRNLYAGLYDSESIDGLVKPSEKFPDRVGAMKKPLSNKPRIIPNENEFIDEFKRIFTKGVDYGESIPEENRKTFFEIMKLCEQTFLWTQGDDKEQLHKIAISKFFNEMRTQIAKERNVEKQDVLSIVATGGKARFIPDIMKSFDKKQISTVILVEDRIENIIEAVDLIKNSNKSINIFPVLILKDENKHKIQEEDLQGIYVIDNINKLPDLLNENNIFSGISKVGSIFDLDGTLTDAKKGRKLQADALIKRFQELEWI